MRKNCLNLIVMANLFLFFVVVSIASAGLENSSRYRATMGVFEQDGDNWFKLTNRPYQLINVQGYWVYTNLSNLTSGKEEFAGDFSDSRYMIGFIGNPFKNDRLNFGLALALKRDAFQRLWGPGNDGAWGYFGVDDDRDGFVDEYDERGYGDDIPNYKENYSDSWTYFTDWDLTGDDEPDTSTWNKYNLNTDGKEDFNNLDFLFSIGYKLNQKITLGLLFHRETETTNTNINGDESFEISGPEIVETRFYYWDDVSFTDNFKDNSKYEKSYHRISLGGKINFSPKLSLMGKLSLLFHNSNQETRLISNKYLDENPNQSSAEGTDNESDNQEFYRRKKISGTGFGIWTKFYNQITPTISLTGYLWYYSQPGNYTASSKDKTSNKELTTNPINNAWTMSHDYSWVDNQQLSGDYSNHNFGLKGRVIVDLGENMRVGLVAGWRKYTEKVEASGSYTVSSNESWNAGDGDNTYSIAYGHLEGTESEVTKGSLRDGWENKLSEFFFPVGVEFKIKEKWTARLGTNFSITTTEKIEYEYDLSGDTYNYIYDYDNPNLNDLADSSVYKESRTYKEVDRTKNSLTHFAYGLGYSLNDNIQIDLMGISKLLDMTHWQISLILRF